MTIDIKANATPGPRVTDLRRNAPEEHIGNQTRPDGATTTAATDDTLTLTASASGLAGLVEAMAAIPVEDANRVQNIKTALANGEYTIDAGRIAHKLLAWEGGL